MTEARHRPDLPPWAVAGLVVLIAVAPPAARLVGAPGPPTALAGVATAVWLLIGLLLARWVLTGDPPAAGLPAARRDAILPVAALCTISAGSGAFHPGPVRTLLPFVLACAAPVVTRWGDGAVLRAAARFGRIVASVLSSVLFAVLGLAAVCLPWLLQRLVRIDPLGTDSSWTQRDRWRTDPSRPWLPEPGLHRRSAAVRLRSAAIVSLMLASLAVTVAPVRTGLAGLVTTTSPQREPFRLGAGILGESPRDTVDFEIRDRVDEDVEAYEPGPNEPQAAMADSAWFNDSNDYNTAQGWALDPGAAWRPVNPYRMLDFRSRWLNVIDGSRSSWRPPSCACHRVTVWMYGGSTTYGLNQRDDHTIASELARVAHDHGITIDIDNRGALGHLHWMEAERFAWDLTLDEAPDMVIFYDGVNEAWAGGTLNLRASGDVKPAIDPTTSDLWDDTGRSAGGVPDGPPGSELIGYPDDITLELGDLERTVVERYDRARTVSRTAAEAHDVAIRYVWQPNRFSRPLVPSEPHADGRGENYSRASQQLMIDALPGDVIDVTDALRGTDEPLFTDDVHHNELGAHLIAEAIFERLRADLESLGSPADPG